jgi:hypothetical protein
MTIVVGMKGITSYLSMHTITLLQLSLHGYLAIVAISSVETTIRPKGDLFETKRRPICDYVADAYI